MFWIIGGDQLGRIIGEKSDWNFAKSIGNQLSHVEWEGFHAYDLVFPLFMFISGVAIPFSILKKQKEGVSKSTLLKTVLKRVITLVILGLIYNQVQNFNINQMRFPSVLGQIGLAYLIATIIALNTHTIKARILAFFSIISAYAIIQLIVPFPGFEPGQLSPDTNINGWIDSLLIPGKLYGGRYDPEGVLCIVSASAITLLGVIAGEVLKNEKWNPSRKIVILCISGCSFLFLGTFFGQWYPIIKSIWTSTFNLIAGGWSLLLLALFYFIIDVLEYQKWTFFFRVIGLNSITIYMAARIIEFKTTSEFLFSGIAAFTGAFAPVVLIGGIILLEWLLLYYLYRKNIFLKV